MKNLINISLLLLILFVVSGCYKEVNPNDENFTIVGDIAQISTLTSPVTTAAANSTINLTIRCNVVNTEIKEFKFYQRIGTSASTPYTATTTVPFVGNFVAAERVHVITVPYTVPNEKGKSFSLQVEAVTANGLVSARRTLTPTNVTIN
jgi:hypothetical protein